LSKVIISCFPGKYVQGPGVLDQISQYSNKNFKRMVLLGDAVVLRIVKERIISSLQRDGKECVVVEFCGESTEAAINNVKEMAVSFGADCIIGAGGGKTFDTARGAAYYLGGMPVIIVPTIASTDAPVSSLVGVYSDDHTHLYGIQTGKNPDLVLVDTEVILKAPIRFLIAGMGDALSTKFEAEAVFQKKALNVHHGSPTQASIAIADLSFRLIIEHGRAALDDVLAGKLTDNVEKIVEANILLSGVGFENGGLAAAHGLHFGLTVLPEMATIPHGEKVAFTTLVQLKMEEMKGKRDGSAFNELVEFYKSTGLPLTLAQLGIDGSEEEVMDKLKKVAVKACVKNSNIHNMPFNVDENFVCEAIMETDRKGRENSK